MIESMSDQTPQNADYIRPSDASSFADLMLRAVRGTDVCIFYQDSKLTYTWVVNPPAGFSSEALIGQTDYDVLPSDAADHVTALKLKALSDLEQISTRVSFDTDGGHRYFDLWIEPDVVDGSVEGIICTAVEKTDEQHRQGAMHALLREVNHRSKNMIAMVVSLANQTASRSETISEFQKSFLGRLRALSASQDVITAQDWTGAALQSLFDRSFKDLTPDQRQRVTVAGLNPRLSPNAATHIGLAIYELLSNSMAYGALSDPKGKVEVHVSPTDAGESAAGLDLVWQETGGTDHPEFSSPKFGFVTLERVVPHAIGGAATLDLEPKAVRYILSIPGSAYDQ